MAESRDDGKPPWKRKNPRKAAGQRSKTLTPGQRQQARARARAAGRPYPNLVDNMAIAAAVARSRKTNGGRKKKSAAGRTSTKRSATSAVSRAGNKKGSTKGSTKSKKKKGTTRAGKKKGKRTTRR